jgi:thymidylate kinase
MGQIIAFEGIDGTGKSSLVSDLSEALRSVGQQTTLVPEFDTDFYGGFILDRMAVDPSLSPCDGLDSPVAQSLVLAASHVFNFEKMMASVRMDDTVTLMDRSILSFLCYQGALCSTSDQRATLENLWTLVKPFTVKPSVVVYCSCGIEEIMRRLERRGDPSLEGFDGFLTRVAQEYERRLLQLGPSTTVVRLATEGRDRKALVDELRVHLNLV